MDSDWVVDQTRIYLIHPLRDHFRSQGLGGFVSGDGFVYYDPDQEPIGPDFYVVRGGRQKGQTKWVAWEEDWLMPTTVIEFLSPSTEIRDRGQKFCIYRDALQVEEYVLVDQESLQIEVNRLNRGHYVSQSPGRDGWYRLASLNLDLGVEGNWLRLRTPDGLLLETADERAQRECARAELERERAEQERGRADRLVAENQALLEELKRLREQQSSQDG